MDNKPIVYCLVHNSYIFDKYPKLIYKPRGVVNKLDFDEKRFSFGRGSFKSEWPSDVVFNVEGEDPVDFLLCKPNVDVVSQRAKNVIQKYAGSDVEFLPLKLSYLSGKPYEKMDYWAINVMTVVDALDWENAKWTSSLPPSRNDPNASFKITVPSFKKCKIENVNFFRYEINGKPEPSRYVSSLVKKELIKSQAFIGMQFTPIKTT